MAYHNLTQIIKSNDGGIKLVSPKWAIMRFKVQDIMKDLGVDTIYADNSIALIRFNPYTAFMRGYAKVITPSSDYSDVIQLYFAKTPTAPEMEMVIDGDVSSAGYLPVIIPFQYPAPNSDRLAWVADFPVVFEIGFSDDYPVTDELELEVGVEFIDLNESYMGKVEDFFVDKDIWGIA